MSESSSEAGHRPPEALRRAVLIDANVLFSPRLRDLFMALLEEDLISLHWTKEIDTEWTRNVIDKQDADRSSIERCMHLMHQAAGEIDDDTDQGWEVTGHEVHLQRFAAVHEKDRHVAAAAYQLSLVFEGPVALVTNNIRDFPAPAFYGTQVSCYSVDAYLTQLMDENLDEVAAAAEACRSKLIKPPQPKDAYLKSLQRLGCDQFAVYLESFWDLQEGRVRARDE